MKQSIKYVLKYFSIFGYKPTLDELYTFLPVKIDKKKLKYTPPQYSIPTSPRLRGASKYQISEKKLSNWRFKIYVKLLSLSPQIKLIGLSGSISMMNAKEEDDIDLFIITAKNRLFTGRLIALASAQILGLRRVRLTTSYQLPTTHYVNKVCLNLFFDERNLKVPKFKQTEFVGHEVLQMKPLVVKGNIYNRFLEENRWVFRLFPNARLVFSMKYKVSSIKKILNTKYYILDTINDWLESHLKSFQMKSINKHKTTELITNTQLWFHPDDFEKKLKLSY